MKVVEAQGFSKVKALEVSGLDIELSMLTNATQAWKKAGSPLSNKEINKFMEAYITKHKGVGAYLVVDPSSDDTRLRPYNVINEVTVGKRKALRAYQVKEAEFSVKYKTVSEEVTNEETGEKTIVEKEIPTVTVKSIGAVEGSAPKKEDAVKLMKELIDINKKNYIIEIVNEIAEGQKYAAYGEYVPSKSAKLGKFMFFVKEV